MPTNNSPFDIEISSTAYADGYRKFVVYKDGILYNTYDIDSSTTVISAPRSVIGKYYAIATDNDTMISKPCYWEVVGGTFSTSLNNTSLSLNYDTSSTIYGIGYKVNDDRYYATCNGPVGITGSGTISFNVLEGASNFAIVIGNDLNASHMSI